MDQKSSYIRIWRNGKQFTGDVPDLKNLVFLLLDMPRANMDKNTMFFKSGSSRDVIM